MGTCAHCQGTGTQRVTRLGHIIEDQTCYFCHGSGNLDMCPACNGNKQVKEPCVWCDETGHLGGGAFTEGSRYGTKTVIQPSRCWHCTGLGYKMVRCSTCQGQGVVPG